MVFRFVDASEHIAELPTPRAYSLYHVENDPNSRGIARATLTWQQSRFDQSISWKEKEDIGLKIKGFSQ